MCDWHIGIAGVFDMHHKRRGYLERYSRNGSSSWLWLVDSRRKSKQCLGQSAIGTFRDLLLHVSAWDGKQTGAIETYMNEGYERDYGGNEAVGKLNENLLEEKLSLTLDQVWAHI
jgi:hypothetical protein